MISEIHAYFFGKKKCFYNCLISQCKECCDFMWGSSSRLGRRRQSRIKPTCPTGCVGSKNKSSKPQIRAEKFKEGKLNIVLFLFLGT